MHMDTDGLTPLVKLLPLGPDTHNRNFKCPLSYFVENLISKQRESEHFQFYVYLLKQEKNTKLFLYLICDCIKMRFLWRLLLL